MTTCLGKIFIRFTVRSFMNIYQLVRVLFSFLVYRGWGVGFDCISS